MDFLFLLLPSLPFLFSFPFFSSSPFPLTPSLSPLPPPQGELFDHGLDSWATILLPLSLFSALGRGNQWGGSPHEAFLPTLAILAGFYLSHWEKYITGILYLPWIYDVLQLVCSCVHNCCSSLGVWHLARVTWLCWFISYACWKRRTIYTRPLAGLYSEILSRGGKN